MTRPLDDIEFLARSANRVTVLETLSAHPQARAELEATTGISKVTVGRILDDCTERGWIRREGDEFHTTATGDVVAADFSRLETTVETAQELRDVAPYLPEVGFDLRRLGDATVTVPDPNDPMAPFERPVELVRGADHVRFLTRMATPVVLEVIRDEVAGGTQTVEAVATVSAVERIRDHPRMATWAREILDSGRAEVYRYDGVVHHEAAMLDETVAILVTDERNLAHGLIETSDETVREWFDAEFETYRERSEPLGPEDFTG